MKKKKLLLSALTTAATLSAIAPLCAMTSCNSNNNHYTTVAKQLKEEAVKIFKEVCCSARHGSYNTGVLYNTYMDWLENNLSAEEKNTIDSDNYFTVACDYDSDHFNKSDIGTEKEFNNFKFDIAPTSGYENKPVLVLQAHMDMVEATKEGASFGQKVVVVEDTVNNEKVIHSEDYKTSIGADNGAGIALMFALVKNSKNFNHGPIRCIITADEEPGMVGPYMASKQEEGKTKGDGKLSNWVNEYKNGNVVQNIKYMINIDNEDAGHLVKACSGGYSQNIRIKKFDTGKHLESIGNDEFVYQIEVSGLKQCHSAEVTSGMVNAIQVVGMTINSLTLTSNPIKLIEMDTPNTKIDATNNVPSKCVATFTLKDEYKGIELFEKAALIQSYIRSNYKDEPEAKVYISLLGKAADTKYSAAKALTNTCSRAVLKLIDSLFFGPLQYLDKEETKLASSSNLAPVYINCNLTDEEREAKAKEGYSPFMLKFYSRSINSDYMIGTIIPNNENAYKAFQNVMNSEVSATESQTEAKDLAVYDPWPIADKNEMIDMLTSAYKSMWIEPSIDIIHGGVENAWWVKLNKQIQTTSIGPTIKGAHTPQETLYIDTFVDEAKAILMVLDKLLAK